MSRYASQTSVSVERSKAEIEKLLGRYGAAEFVSGWSGRKAMLGFILGDRSIRFDLMLPDRYDPEFTETPARGTKRTEAAAEKAWEQACRASWRALLLVIKAKLEAVEVGISTVETEFLAWTVIPGTTQTISQRLEPEIQKAIESGGTPQLLLGAGD